MIFADLSKIHSMDTAHFLIDILKGFGFTARIVWSLSSVIQHYTNPGDTKADTLRKFLVQFDEIHITTGFTDDEASKYIEKKNLQLMLNQVRHISGTNPLLLSLIRRNFKKIKVTYIHSYLKSVLVENLKGLGLNVYTIEDYFINQEMLECRQFAYYAIREDSLASYLNILIQRHYYAYTYSYVNIVLVYD